MGGFDPSSSGTSQTNFHFIHVGEQFSTCGNCLITVFTLLQFTLFMAGMVIFPYIIIGIFRKQHDALRTDNAFSDFSEKQY